MNNPPFRVRVTEITVEARDVLTLELRAASDAPLPVFAPGAHIELALPNGLVRHYSLCNDSRERDRYVIGVGRAPASRGGSRYIHQSLRVGDSLVVTAVRNNFPLADGAPGYRFIAGGIGITPLLSMIRHCQVTGAPWSLLYCVRSRQRAAFQEELARWPGRVRYHVDEESAGAPPGLAAAAAAPAVGEQLYCCGPDGLMRAVRESSGHWPSASVHFEWFSTPAETSSSVTAGDHAFELVLRRQGRTLTVPAGRTILDTLEEHDVMVPFACREGLCRTCETSVCAGEVEHRDFVLSATEREAGTSMMICVSRARGKSLELDL